MFRAGDRIGSYTLIEKIGRGTFGVVWLAEEKTSISSHKVALKLPNEEDIDLDAIRQEADVWEKVKGHPNILPIIKADNIDGQLYIASEYAPDGSLYKWLKLHDGKAPTIESAVKMIQGILSGLEHLHSKGVIHRDLKPENILLQADTPRIADFGIARLVQATSNSTQVTGTPAYMAPECFYGVRSAQTDIWAVGIILHLLLTGKLPYPQPDQISIMNAVLNGEPQIENNIPVKFQQIIRKSLQKEPTQRYQSVSEIRRDLSSSSSFIDEEIVLQPTVKFQPILNEELETVVIAPLYQSQVTEKPANYSNLWKIAMVILILLLGGAGTIWYSFQSDKKDKMFGEVNETNANVPLIPPVNTAFEINASDSTNTAHILPLSNSNSSTLTVPESLANSEGSPYWQDKTTIPSYTPQPVPPSEQVIDPNTPNSPVTKDEAGTIYQGPDGKYYMFVPPNSNANVKTSSTPKTTKSPNPNVIQPTVVPNDTTKPQTTPTPEVKTTPAKTPAAKPTPQPKNSPSSTKQTPSGKTQDS